LNLFVLRKVLDFCISVALDTATELLLPFPKIDIY